MKALNSSGGKNRLRFQGVGERIEEARSRVDVVHKVHDSFIPPDEPEVEGRGEEEVDVKKQRCLLQEQCYEYLELNPSREFKRFGYSLLRYIRSLPEVLHHLSIIVTLLHDKLVKPWGPAHQHVLALISVLAKEVGPELYPDHFHTLMGGLVSSLDPSRPEDTSRCFETMGYLLKHLARRITTDMDGMKRYYGPLLGHKTEFIRRYAAECLSALIRRLKEKALSKQLKSIMGAAITVLNRHGVDESASKSLTRRGGDLIDGLSLLLYHTMRGVQGRLHSCTSTILRFLLTHLQQPSLQGASHHVEIAKGALVYLCHYVRPAHVGPLFTELLNGVDPSIAQSAPHIFERHLTLLVVPLSHMNGILLSHDGIWQDTAPPLSKLVSALVDSKANSNSNSTFSSLPSAVQDQVITVFLSIWHQYRSHGKRANVTEAESLCRRLVKMITGLLSPGACQEQQSAVALADTLLADIRDNRQGPADERLQQAVLTACLKRCCSGKEGGKDAVVDVQGELLQALVEHGERSDGEGPVFDASLLAPLARGLVPYLQQSGSADDKSLLALRCLPFFIHRLRAPLQSDLSKSCLGPLKSLAIKGTDIVIQALAVRALVQLWALPGMAPKDDVPGQIWTRLLTGLRTNPCSISRLQALLALAESLPPNKHTTATLISENGLLPCLLPALRSPSHGIRLTALQLLSSFPPPDFLEPTDDKDKDSPFQGPCPVLSILLELEQLPISVAAEREYSLRLTRLEVMARSGRLPPLLQEALATYCLGLLFVKFATVWPLAIKTLATAAEGHEEMAWRPLLATWEHLATLPLGDLNMDKKEGDEEEDQQSIFNVLKRIDDGSGKVQLDQLTEREAAWVRLMSGLDVGLGPGSRGSQASRHSTTDALTATTWIISSLRQCPSLVLRRSKFTVVTFLSFLHREYFPLYPDDPEARILDLAGPQANVPDLQGLTPRPRRITGKAARTVLLSFLELFASLNSPKQLYHHALLERVYCSLLTKPDPAIAKLALDSLLTYKSPALVPYQDNLRALLKDTTLRDELTKFTVGDLQPEHRILVLPILVRLLFGRFLSKSKKRSSKDTPSARRAAIVAFLAGAEDASELTAFMQLMFRPFLRDASKAFNEPNNLDPSLATATQQQGFLNLLRTVVRQLGYRVVTFIPSFMELLLGLLENAAKDSAQGETEEAQEEDGEEKEQDEEDEVVVEEEEGAGRRKKKGSGAMRSLALMALADLMEQFAAAYDFVAHSQRLWSSLDYTVSHLPTMALGASRVPALLHLCETLCAHKPLLPVYEANQASLTPSLLSCLSPGGKDTQRLPSPLVLTSVLQILRALLDYNEGVLLLPYLADVVKNFALLLKFQQDQASAPQLAQELEVLCRITEMATNHAKSGEPISSEQGQTYADLMGLLLPRLRVRTIPGKEDTKAFILRTYASLVSAMPAPRKDLVYLSKLLGPSGITAGMTSLTLRPSLVEALVAMADNHTLRVMQPIVKILQDLNAMDEGRVESRDYERCMPVWARLSRPDTWAGLVVQGSQREDLDVLPIVPLIQQCLVSLHDDEVVVRSGALGALKALVQHVATQENPDGLSNKEQQSSWMWLLTSSLIPSLRAGIGNSSDQIRQGYINILAHVVRTFSSLSSSKGASSDPWASSLHTDLAPLLRDDPETDFFNNMSHIQVHRRARALQRLRKSITSTTDDSLNLTSSTLVHIVLPLSSQPLFPQTVQPKAIDPNLIHEAIATTSEVARLMAWSHYHKLVQRFIRMLGRLGHAPSPAVEKALVSGLCGVLDAFPFTVKPPKDDEEEEEKEEEEEGEGDDEADAKEGANEMVDGNDQDKQPKSASNGTETAQSSGINTAIWRALTLRLIPAIRGLLMRETTDKEGSKNHTLRAPMALALLKILQLLPPEVFSYQLTRLLMVVCAALRSRDSNTRDAARDVLCKMVVDLGPTHLPSVLHQITAALREGYQLHIRTFTIHAVLLALAGTYVPPDAPSIPIPQAMAPEAMEVEEGAAIEPVQPPFDSCIKGLMELLMEDLFGDDNTKAKEEEEGMPVTKSSGMKEAKGQKAMDSLEIIARCLLFRPTYAVRKPEDPTTISSVHALVTPLLWCIHDSEVTNVHGRVNEAFQRVVTGLSQNPSLKIQEVLLYVYGLVSPFLVKADRRDQEDQKAGRTGEASESEESDLEVEGEVKLYDTQENRKKNMMKWLPVDASLKMAVEARQEQRMRNREELRVLDGKNAPKLSGHGRHHNKQLRAKGGMFGDPAALAAVSLGLRLMHAFLKRPASQAEGTAEADKELLQSLLDPYVRLLTNCLRRKLNDAVVLLALNILNLLLRQPKPLPSVPQCVAEIGKSVLRLLTLAGGPANSQDEMVQGCMKTLTLILQQENLAQAASMPLDDKAQRALVSLLQSAALNVGESTSTFSLIRALVSRHVVVPEMYDLMERLLDLAVTSRRQGVRQISAQIFVRFLVEYPLGPARLAAHLKRAVANLEYEYEDGRVAAIEMLMALIGKVPTPVLDEQAQLFFLPLVLRLVQDGAPRVRGMAADALQSLLRHVSGDIYHLLLEYVMKWLEASNTAEGQALKRAAAQCTGLFAEARQDLFKRKEFGPRVLDLLASLLSHSMEGAVVIGNSAVEGRDLEAPQERVGETMLSWEMVYHCLRSLEKVYAALPGSMESFLETPCGQSMLRQISDLLCYRHAWVRLAASRFLGQYLDRRPLSDASKCYYISDSKEAFSLVRRLCVQLDRPNIAEELNLRAVKNLVFMVVALVKKAGGAGSKAPHDDDDKAGDIDDGDEGEGEGEEDGGDEGQGEKDPVPWVFHRLSFMSRKKGEDRRCAAFRFFAAVTSLVDPPVVERYLPHMLSPLYRATTDGQSEETASGNNACEVAKEVLEVIENKVGTSAYLEAFTRVQKAMSDKRDKRKRERAVEAITEPAKAAKRKMEKNLAKRSQGNHKRKAEEFMAMKGKKRKNGPSSAGGRR